MDLTLDPGGHSLIWAIRGHAAGLEMEAVVLHGVGFLEYFCPKHGQDFKPSAAPLYPNLGQVPPPKGGHWTGNVNVCKSFLKSVGYLLSLNMVYMEQYLAIQVLRCLPILSRHQVFVLKRVLEYRVLSYLARA